MFLNLLEENVDTLLSVANFTQQKSYSFDNALHDYGV